MSKTILADVDGFTPLIDTLADAEGLVTAAVFGRIWRFCQMSDGVCRASLEKISESLGIDRATVQRHADKLCDLGYIKDTTPNLKNRPHIYIDTGKAGIRVSIGVAERNVKNESVAQSNVTVADGNETVAESRLKKVLKTDSKETSSLPTSRIKRTDEEQSNLDDAKIKAMLGSVDEIGQAAAIACEAAFHVSQWPWCSTSVWTKFYKFVKEIYQADPQAFEKYIRWCRDGGKYQSMSTRKIRENPQMFMDTGWPTFLAHTEMYEYDGGIKSHAL